MPNKLTNLRIDEVSSVDRGAGMGVRVLLMKRDDEPYWKREFSADERQSAASSGAALPDGSFPIKSKQDLRNAIQAIGRAKDRAKAMAHIKSRARALGATDMLPDSWSKRDDDANKALELAITSILGIGDTKADAVAKMRECFQQFHKYLNGDESKEQDMDLTSEALAEMIKGAVESTLKDYGVEKKAPPPPKADAKDDKEPDADDAEKNKNMDKSMTDDEAKKLLAKLGIKFDKADVKKDAPPKDAEIAKRDAEIVDLRKHVETLLEKNAIADFAKRAENIGLTAAEGENLRKAFKGDLAALNWMVEKIDTLHKQVEKAGLFGEIGSGGGAPVNADAELKAKAAELRKTDTKLTEAQAYVKAMELYPDIAKREREESHARIQKVAQ